MAYITSAQLGDGTWKGSTGAFILHWQDHVRRLELLLPPTDHFADSMKRSLLENAVHGIPELRAVKTQADQLLIQSKIALTYTEYCDLLSGAAGNYDQSFVNAPSRNRPPPRDRRMVLNHELYPDPDQDVSSYKVAEPSDCTYDIDSSLDVITANAH